MRLPDAANQIRLAPVRALRAVFSGVGQLLLAADRLREEDARQEQEPGGDQPDALPPWDGRLSSSVRLLSPTGMPVGKPGRSAAGKAQPADSARAGRPGKAAKPAKPATSKRKNGDAKPPAATKTGNAGGGRRSGRSKSVAEPSRFRSLDLTGNVRMLTDQDVADEFELGAADAQPLHPAEPLPAARTGPPAWSDAAPSWSSWSTGPAPTPELPITGYDDLSLPSLRARLRSLGTAELAQLLGYERSHANREDVVAMFERRIAKLAEPAG